MAWMSKAEAARALDISTRTLARQLAGGKYKTKFDGCRILVCVPDDSTATRAATACDHTDKIAEAGEHVTATNQQPAHSAASATARKEHDADRAAAATVRDHADKIAEAAEHIAATGRQLAEIAACAASQKKHDGDMVASTATAFDEIRSVLEENAVRARQDAQRADAARRRAYQAVRWVSGAAAVLVLVAVISLAWVERRHHQVAKVWADELGRVGTSLASIEARADELYRIGTSLASIEARADELDRVGTSLASVEARAEEDSAALRKALAAQRTEAARTITELQDRLAAASETARTTAQAGTEESAELRIELDLLRHEHNETLEERDRLAAELSAMRKDTGDARLRVTLRELIDQSWNDVNIVTSKPSSRTRTELDQLSAR